MRSIKRIWLAAITAVLVFILAYTPIGAAIIQAVIPQVVPTANKRGNSTVFALASSNTAGSAGATACDDGSGNLTYSGCSGGGATVGSPLFVQTASATVTSNSETTLLGAGTGSLTIPANWFTGAGTVLDACGSGILTTAASPGTMRIRLKFGTTVIADTAAFTPVVSITNSAYDFCLRLTARTVGVSGTVMVSNIFPFVGATVTPGEANFTNPTPGTAVTVNTTTTNVVDLTVLFSLNATNSITQTNFYMAGPGSAVSSVMGQTGATNIPFTTTDISTPATPSSGTTTFYTKTGKLCSLSPAAVENCTGAGGSSLISGVGVFGSRPGSGTNTGDLYKSTDSPINSIWTGAAWSNFAFDVPVTLPQAATTFATAVNVGTSTITNTTGPTVLTHTDATNVVGWVTSIFTNTGAFFFNIEPAVHNSFQSGVMFRESGTGKLLVFTIAFTTSTTQINVDRWNNATSFNANVFRQTYQPLSAPFFALRLRVVGTALDCDVSWDAGQHWLLVYTETKTAFFTTAPDQDGPCTIISGDVETLYNYSTT